MNKEPIKMREIFAAVCFSGMMICAILEMLLQLFLPEDSRINLIIIIIFCVYLSFTVGYFVNHWIFYKHDIKK